MVLFIACLPPLISEHSKAAQYVNHLQLGVVDICRVQQGLGRLNGAVLSMSDMSSFSV